MGITHDFSEFVSLYHNKYKTKISCIIFNNVNNKGVNEYKYLDNRKDNKLIYHGQKKGRDDKYIKEGETLYLEKYKYSEEYNYIGLVKDFVIEKDDDMNIFNINLDTKYIHNGIKCGDKLEYVNGVLKGKGSYCFKKSALIRLGFEPIGNMFTGIMKIK